VTPAEPERRTCLLGDFTSAPGEGTRVDLYLPIAGEAAPVAQRSAVEPLQAIGRRLNVLLVDDEDLVRTATAEMIRDLGHKVAEADGALEALSRLERGFDADVVVTDYMMPGMDGGALARRIAETHPDVAVLLITGYTGPTNDVMHLPRLAKPFGQSEIAASIAALFAEDENVVRLPRR